MPNFKSQVQQQKRRASQASSKQADLYNTGMPGDNPFQSMYQATIGSQARPQTTRGGRQASATPAFNSRKMQQGGLMDHRQTPMAKSAAKMNFSAKREQPRKFGEFHGEDGLETQAPATSIWKNTPFQALPTGYQGARQTRCVDRFVRYPYPKRLYSNYKQNYHGKLAQTEVKDHKQAFNLEKESKIINPHNMDLQTTNKSKYKGEKGERAAQKVNEIVDTAKPIQQTTSYHASFPNWDNGKNDIFHEKHPQYPYYALPFAGGSTYKNAHTTKQQKDLRRLQDVLDKNHHSNSLKLSGYIPTNFEFQTTNAKFQKDFRFVDSHPQEKVMKVTPQAKPVLTKSLPGHFKTVNQRELLKHPAAAQVVDRIPYP